MNEITDEKPILGEFIEVTLGADEPEFSEAKDAAREAARRISPDAMMLSWKNNITGDFYPQTRCGREDASPWILFARSRGADLTVHVNDGAFVFLFLKVTGLSNPRKRS